MENAWTAVKIRYLMRGNLELRVSVSGVADVKLTNIMPYGWIHDVCTVYWTLSDSLVNLCAAAL